MPEPVCVLHLAGLINRYDFIDTVIRFADQRRYRMMACALMAESDIEAPGYEDDGIPFYVLGCSVRWQYPLGIMRLARMLRRHRVRIVHTHHYEEGLIGVLAARLAGTARVVIGRHYHDELYLSAAGAKLRTLLAIEGFCNRNAHAIVVPSTAIRRLLIERQRVPEGKIRVIPYGFDFGAERYRLPESEQVRTIRRELGLNDHFVIGNFGRHHSLKGQDYLLRAFAGFARTRPDARLLMVGEGPYSEALRALAKDLGVEGSTVFAGWRRDVARLMAAVDVVVHPTLLDSFPQVMIEALVLGKPLIVTDAAGPSDQILHGKTGLLVPMRDDKAIEEALHWVIAHPEAARRLGEAGRRHVLTTLNIRQVIRRYEACYEAALRG